MLSPNQVTRVMSAPPPGAVSITQRAPSPALPAVAASMTTSSFTVKPSISVEKPLALSWSVTGTLTRLMCLRFMSRLYGPSGRRRFSGSDAFAGPRLRHARPPHQRVAARDGRRAASFGRLLPVRGGGHAGELGEPGAEGAQAGEANQVADLGHGQVGRTEQLAGTLHPPPGPVAAGGLAVGRAERPDEVLARVAGPGGQRRDVDLLGVVAVDPVPGPAQHPQRDNIGLLHRLSPASWPVLMNVPVAHRSTRQSRNPAVVRTPDARTASILRQQG